MRVTYNLSPELLGMTVASALWGTVLGAMLAGFPGEKYGRRDSLRGDGSPLCDLRAGLRLRLELARIGGLPLHRRAGHWRIFGLGPMYIAEIAPAKWRGRLVGFFQFNVVFGILLAYFSNYLIGLAGFGSVEWRWELGVTAIPAILFFLLLFVIPRSPRWLAAKGFMDEARSVLRMIGEENYEQQLKNIKESIEEEKAQTRETSFPRNTHCRFFSR